MADEMRKALEVARNWIVNGSPQIGWNIDRLDAALAEQPEQPHGYFQTGVLTTSTKQPEQRGEPVASVKNSLTVRAAFEAWLAWWSTLPNDRDKHGYCDMTVEMLSHAYAAGMTRSAQVEQRGEAVPINQFRVNGGASWNDGLPPTDHYETRTLYTAPPAPSVPDDVAKNAARWRLCEAHPGWLRQVRKGKGMWFAFASPTTNYEYDIYPTARQAIDAAMITSAQTDKK